MSFWIKLVDKDNNTVQTTPHTEGGTIVLGGNSDCDLNITYNYSNLYRLVNFDPEDLNDKIALTVIPTLERVVKELGTTQFSDYWAPTPGNAGYAMNILLQWAKQHPHSKFVYYGG